MDHFQTTSHQVLHNAHSLRWPGGAGVTHPKMPAWRSQLASQGRPESPYRMLPVHHTSPFLPTSQHNANSQSETAYNRQLAPMLFRAPPSELASLRVPKHRPSSNKPSAHHPHPASGRPRLLPSNKALPPSPPSPSSSATTATISDNSARPSSNISHGTSKLGSKRPRSWDMPPTSDTILPPRLSYKSPFQPRRHAEQSMDDPITHEQTRANKARVIASPASCDNLSGHVTFENCSLRNSSVADGITPTSSPNILSRPRSSSQKLEGDLNGSSPALDVNCRGYAPVLIKPKARHVDELQGSVAESDHQPGSAVYFVVKDAAGHSEGAQRDGVQAGEHDELPASLQVKESSHHSKAETTGDAEEVKAKSEPSGAVPMQVEELTQIGVLVNMGMLKLTAATRKALAASLAAQQGSNDNEKLQALKALLEGPSPSPTLSTRSSTPRSTQDEPSNPPSTLRRHQLDCTPVTHPHTTPQSPDAMKPEPTESQPRSCTANVAAKAASNASGSTVTESGDNATVTQSQDTVTDPNSDSAADHDEATATSQDKHVIIAAIPQCNSQNIPAAAAPRTVPLDTRELDALNSPPKREAAKANKSASARTADPAASINSHPVCVDSPPSSPRQSFVNTVPRRSPSPVPSSSSPTGKSARSFVGPAPDATAIPASAFQALNPDLQTMLTLGARNFIPPHAAYSSQDSTYSIPLAYAQAAANGSADGVQMLLIPPNGVSQLGSSWQGGPTPVTILPNGQVVAIPMPMLYSQGGRREESAAVMMYQPTVVPMAAAYDIQGMEQQQRANRCRVQEVVVPAGHRVVASVTGLPVESNRVPAEGSEATRDVGSQSVMSDDAIMELRNTVLEVYCNQKELDSRVDPDEPPSVFAGDGALWQRFLDQVEDSRRITHHLLRETANLYSPIDDAPPASQPLDTPSPAAPILNHPASNRTFAVPPPPPVATPSTKSPLQNQNLNASHSEPANPRYKWSLPMVSAAAPKFRPPAVSNEGYWSPDVKDTPTKSPTKVMGILRPAAFIAKKTSTTATVAAFKSPPTNEPVIRIPVASVQASTGARKFATAASSHLPKHIITSATPKSLHTKSFAVSPSQSNSPTKQSPAYHAHDAFIPKTSSPSANNMRHDEELEGAPTSPKAVTTSTKAESPTVRTSGPASPTSPARKRTRDSDAEDNKHSPSKRMRDAHGRTSSPDERSTAPCALDVQSMDVDTSSWNQGKQAQHACDVSMELSQIHPKYRAKRFSPKKDKVQGSCSTGTAAADEVTEDVDAVEGLLQLATSAGV